MNRLDHKIARFLITFVSIAVIFSASYFAYGKYLGSHAVKSLTIDNVAEQSNVEETLPAEAKEAITKEPPKYDQPQKTTVKESGDKKIVTLSEGSINPDEIESIRKNGSGGANPYSVKFVDETGRYPFAETALKDYLNKLRWSNEISALYQISIKDMGEVGWSGQWVGSYTINLNGDIISAYGVIYLNSSYYKKYSNDTFLNYMKLILSHEYGHHYTQYYKWVNLDIPIGQRFPDTYYSIRPLSKENTTVDCTNWRTCESEIVAEDYSYLYSGFGIHQLSSSYGYPSNSTKGWFDSLSNFSGHQAEAEPVAPEPAPAPVDNPPSIAMADISEGAILNGSVSIKANTSDDKGISKVRFYIDDVLVAEKTADPYQFNLDTTLYQNGQHVIKAAVYDTSYKSSEAKLTITIKNPPTVTIDSPTENPFTWTEETKNLKISVRTSPNDPIVKIKIYLDEELQQEIDAANVDINWKYTGGPMQEYTLRVEAIDQEGTTAETTLTIIKQ